MKLFGLLFVFLSFSTHSVASEIIGTWESRDVGESDGSQNRLGVKMIFDESGEVASFLTFFVHDQKFAHFDFINSYSYQDSILSVQIGTTVGMTFFTNEAIDSFFEVDKKCGFEKSDIVIGERKRVDLGKKKNCSLFRAMSPGEEVIIDAVIDGNQLTLDGEVLTRVEN